MATDQPHEVPPQTAPDRPAESDPINDPIGEQAMQKWDAAMDRLNAENLLALRQEQAILTGQGNYDGAAELEKQVALIPLSEEIKANLEGFLAGDMDKPDGQAPTPDASPSGEDPGALRAPLGDQGGHAFTVRTPFPGSEQARQADPPVFTDLGSAADLVPESERVDNPHPLPMGWITAKDAPPPPDRRDKPPEDPDAATAAWNDQGYPGYPGKDDWHNITAFEPGTLLVQAARVENGVLAPSDSAYFTGIEQLKASGLDATYYNMGSQVGARNGVYREGVAVYRVTQRLDGVAEGTASANGQHGKGGDGQYYTRGTDCPHAVTPQHNSTLTNAPPGEVYFEPVPWGEVKGELGIDRPDIPDDATFIPMTHTSSPLNPLRGQ